jgi:hypothetical protein
VHVCIAHVALAVQRAGHHIHRQHQKTDETAMTWCAWCAPGARATRNRRIMMTVEERGEGGVRGEGKPFHSTVDRLTFFFFRSMILYCRRLPAIISISNITIDIASHRHRINSIQYSFTSTVL